MSFPIIDISSIDSPSSQADLAHQITEASSKWGFLLLKGHSIPQADISQMFALGKTFFDLPDADKDPYPITAKQIGYMGSFRDRHRDDKMSMWFGGATGTLSQNSNSLPPFWHEHAEAVDGFKHKCHDLILKLLECFAIALDLPDRNFFSKAHTENSGDGFRMLMYPSRAQMPSFEGLGSRMAAHTDSGSVTLLFQRAPGLEVLSPEGQWVKAPHIESCILVNLGDTLSFWSGTQLKATQHRVTFDTVSHDQERQSMAYFGKASPDTVLQPIKASTESKRYYSNGVELRSGMTVDELSITIMRNIYKGALESTGKPDVAVSSTSRSVTAV